MKAVIRYKGGSGSGNFNHSGRPGKVGGSAPSNMISDVDPYKYKQIRATLETAIRKNLPAGYSLTVGGPMGTGWESRSFEINIEQDLTAFASIVLWYRRTDQIVKLQQHDISLPEHLQGKGIGGTMIKAIIAGFKAIGVGNVPIHMDTNPDFWNAMRKKYPDMYE